MIEGILIGLTTALTFQNILMVMIGCFFGTIIGMLPGLGPMTAIALMIPITYGFDPATSSLIHWSIEQLSCRRPTPTRRARRSSTPRPRRSCRR